MTQWAEIRHLHLVEGVAKKQIARRLQLDIKTVRRALEQPTPPARASSPRVRSLDPWREQIAQWLDQDRVADTFGHVRVDHETYSVPIRHAYRPVWVKLVRAGPPEGAGVPRRCGDRGPVFGPR